MKYYVVKKLLWSIALMLGLQAGAQGIVPPPPGERHVIELSKNQSGILFRSLSLNRYASRSAVRINDGSSTCTGNVYQFDAASSGGYLGNDIISCTDRTRCGGIRLEPVCIISTLEAPGTSIQSLMKFR